MTSLPPLRERCSRTPVPQARSPAGAGDPPGRGRSGEAARGAARRALLGIAQRTHAGLYLAHREPLRHRLAPERQALLRARQPQQGAGVTLVDLARGKACLDLVWKAEQPQGVGHGHTAAADVLRQRFLREPELLGQPLQRRRLFERVEVARRPGRLAVSSSAARSAR